MVRSLSLSLFIYAALCLVTPSISRATRYQYRQYPTAPLTYAQYPSYNLHEPNGPGTYAFGFEFEDAASGNVQFRDEERLANGTVRGSYGYVRPDGMLTLTRYWDDGRGYRSETETFNRLERPHGEYPEPAQETTISPPIEDNSYEQPSLSPEQVEQILHNHQINLKPSYDPIDDPNIVDQSVASILGGQMPAIITSKDGKDRFSVQFVNNFIPSNFPIISFQSPERDVQPLQPVNDEIDPSSIVNDKFHDPIFDERQHGGHRKRVIVRKPVQITKNRQQQLVLPSTKEARWYRRMIQNRRRDYLQKYSTNYDSLTIPANYLVRP